MNNSAILQIQFIPTYEHLKAFYFKPVELQAQLFSGLLRSPASLIMLNTFLVQKYQEPLVSNCRSTPQGNILHFYTNLTTNITGF